METARPPLLIVDDDDDTRDVLASLLADQGYPVRPVESAERALDYLREHRAAAVFLDLQLPDMNGLDLIGILRDDPVLRLIPIVVMTGSPDLGVPDGIRVLAKPFDFGTLLELAEMHCGHPTLI